MMFCQIPGNRLEGISQKIGHIYLRVLLSVLKQEEASFCRLFSHIHRRPPTRSEWIDCLERTVAAVGGVQLGGIHDAVERLYNSQSVD